MKILKLLAAATAAGMVTFAANSQEAPFNAAAGNPAAFAGLKNAATTDPRPAIRIVDRGRFEVVDPTGAAATSKTAAAQAEKGEMGTVATSTTSRTIVSTTSQRAALTKVETLTADGKYHNIIARYASTYGVPTSLAHAIIQYESNYHANARGRAGEIGLMQIKHSTARGMGYAGSAKGLYDPETNIKYGMKYLAAAHKLGGGNTCGTILRYNAGHGAKRMNPTSAAYCTKIKRLLGSS